MNQIQDETCGAVPRHFRLLCFVSLVLALSFGSLVSNAAQQGGADKTPCQITGINLKTGVVSAKDSSNGQSFRFFVKASALRSSLTEGQEILADFNTQEVFTSPDASGQSVRLGGILTDYYGKNVGAPSGGSGTGAGAQSQAGSQSGPPPQSGGGMGGAGQSQAGPPCGPPPQFGGGMSGGNMGGGLGGAGQSQAGSPCGPSPQSGGVGNPLAGQNLGNAANPSFGNPGGVGDTVAGQNPVNLANPGQPNCQITNIDAATGLVRAKNVSTGQEFQFKVKDAAQLRSLNVGQSFFANVDSRQVSFDGKSFSGIQSFSFFNAGTQN